MRLSQWTAHATSTALTLGVTLAVGVVVVVGGVVAPSASASGRAPVAVTEIEGVVVRLADQEGHEPQTDTAHASERPVVAPPAGTALRTADGAYVRVAGEAVADVESGVRLRATVRVPGAVLAAARAAEPVTAPSGEQVLVRAADVADATDGTPAEAESVVAEAAAATAATTNTPLTASAVRVLAPTTNVAYQRGAHDVTVAVVVPAGVTGGVASERDIRAQVAAASAYWSEQSRGGVTLRLTTLSTPYRSAHACSDPFDLWAEAARRTGFSEGPRAHLVLSLPRTAPDEGCSYGLASIGTRPDSGGVALVSDSAWPVLAHELGHNLGFGHAKSLTCARSDAALTTLPTGCSLTEYGNPWSVMAASAPDRAGMLSSAQAARSGLMPASDVVSMTGGTRTVTLRPLSTGTGIRAVQVTDPISGEVYFVEYRTRSGRDRRLYVDLKDGVRVVRVDSTVAGGRGSVLLDATPTGRHFDHTRRLEPGRTFTSYTGGVSVTTRSAGSTASVVVTASSGSRRPAAGSTRAAAPGRAAVGVPAVDATAAATVRWSGAAAGARYDVRYRAVLTNARGGRTLGSIRPWWTGTRRTSAVLQARAGAVYQVSVRARTAAAAGAWSTWRTVTFATDAGARGTTLSGRWAAGRGSGYYAGTYLTTSARGAALARGATWTNRVDVVGPKHARGSLARVYVDGRLRATVDTYAARTVQRRVLASVAVPWGRHTVRIVNAPTGTRSNLVVDAVAYGR